MTESSEEVKLYAGKYKTVEELEEGYKKSLPTFQENENLKKQLDEANKVPDNYLTPEGIALHEKDLEVVRAEAKNSGLTQKQYEKLVRERNARSAAKHQQFEDSKKELGADKINLLQDYLKKTYPEKIAETLLTQAIQNKEIREQIMVQRKSALDSNVPGAGSVPGIGTHRVTDEDVLKARSEMLNSRGRSRVTAQEKYLNLLSQMAEQKKS